MTDKVKRARNKNPPRHGAHFEIYPVNLQLDEPPLWNWRYVAANGEIMCHSNQGYTSRSDARRAVNTFCSLLGIPSEPNVIYEDN